MNFQNWNSKHDELYLFALKSATYMRVDDPGGVALQATISACRAFNPKRGSFQGLLSACLRFKVLDEKRRTIRMAERFQRLDESHIAIVDETERASSRDASCAIDQVLKKLGEGDRLLLRLRFWEGKGYEEISCMREFRGSTSVSLRARVSRMLRALRAHPELKREFLNN